MLYIIIGINFLRFVLSEKFVNSLLGINLGFDAAALSIISVNFLIVTDCKLQLI